MDWYALQFSNGDKKSVVLAQHGPGLYDELGGFLDGLCEDIRGWTAMPLQRLEPAIVIVEFLRFYLECQYGRDERVYSGLYLHPDWPDDCSLKTVDLGALANARKERE